MKDNEINLILQEISESLELLNNSNIYNKNVIFNIIKRLSSTIKNMCTNNENIVSSYRDPFYSIKGVDYYDEIKLTNSLNDSLIFKGKNILGK